MRLLLSMLIISSCAYGANSFFGEVVNASVAQEIQTIRVVDSYENGKHSLSGMVVVPSECVDLTVRVRDIDAKTVALVFETWEQPYRTCTEASTPRAFTASIFAPESTLFRAFLDAKPSAMEFTRRMKAH